jgi:arginine exporter protein ArgO
MADGGIPLRLFHRPFSHPRHWLTKRLCAQNKPLWFWLGVTSTSFAFFFSLGYGAILLRPVFENPKAWKVLDGVIGVVMWAIAWRLVAG